MNYKIIDGEKVYGYRWIILALMGLACIVVNGSTLVFAGMAGILLNPTGPWAFDAQQFMMLTSCSYLTGFLFCMVTGTMADRMGIKKVLVIGLAISAIGAILRIFWGGFAGMFVTSVIFGFGLAALNANSAKIISLWFPGKMISVAMGIYLCCATVGCALAVPLAGMATEPTPVFVAVAVLSVIVAVLWAVLYKKHPDNEQRIVEPVMKHLGVVVKSKNLWVACLVIGFVMAAGAVNNGYLVAALSGDPTVGGKALDYTFATLTSSICNITCSVGGIMFPLIFSKTHNEKWWLVGLCAAVIVGIGIYWFMLDGIATAVGVMIVSVLVAGSASAVESTSGAASRHQPRAHGRCRRPALHHPERLRVPHPVLRCRPDLRPELRSAQWRSVCDSDGACADFRPVPPEARHGQSLIRSRGIWQVRQPLPRSAYPPPVRWEGQIPRGRDFEIGVPPFLLDRRRYVLGVQPCLRKVQAAEAEGRDVPLVRRGHVLLQGGSPVRGKPSLPQMRRGAVRDGRA